MTLVNIEIVLDNCAIRTTRRVCPAIMTAICIKLQYKNSCRCHVIKNARRHHIQCDSTNAANSLAVFSIFCSLKYVFNGVVNYLRCRYIFRQNRKFTTVQVFILPSSRSR